MNSAKPIALWVAPSLALGASLTLMLLESRTPAPFLGVRLWTSWQSLMPGTLTRPAFLFPTEIAVLLLLGAGLILALVQLRLTWAGLFAAAAIIGCFYISWFLYVTRHWAIDAVTPGAGLLAIFLTAALTQTAQMRMLHSRLRLGFSDSLPGAIMAKIARRPALLSLEGETRDITYLVCDIKGLAGLAACYRDNPKTYNKLMRQTLSPLMSQVLAHGGAIDRLTAEGFAAFWNAPLDDPDHALHACEAANGMAAMAAEINETIAATRRLGDKITPPLEIGIGIATGPVIAGGFGRHGRQGYSVHGETVTLAGRLQALSPQYGPAVIVAEETHRLAAQGFAFLEVDYVAMDDDAPVKLYAMLGNPVARASPKFRALATFHEHLFNALRGQQWEQARGLIEQCRRLSGASQALYDLHLTRIQYFETHPPGLDWDGAFRPVLR